jgi:hypothetical protein
MEMSDGIPLTPGNEVFLSGVKEERLCPVPLPAREQTQQTQMS